MSDSGGFTSMAAAGGSADVAPIGIGMLATRSWARRTPNGYKTLAYMTWPPPLRPDLVAIAGRNEEAVAEAARRYGFAEHVTDWRALIATTRIGLFDNAGPNNLHAEPTIAAAEAGKHVICEKPLGRDAAESYRHWQRCRPPASSTCAPSTTASCRPSASRARSSRPATSATSTTSAAPTCRSGAPRGRGLALRQGAAGRARSATSART
jgi:transposase-like protein